MGCKYKSSLRSSKEAAGAPYDEVRSYLLESAPSPQFQFCQLRPLNHGSESRLEARSCQLSKN